jgi:soluble P-type ATPase
MINIEVPSFGDLQLVHLVLDYNGTLAVNGKLLCGVFNALTALSSELEIHVITADTFGFAASQLVGLPVKLTIIPAEEQAEAKLKYISQLGAQRNDRMILKAAAVGIAVIQSEAASRETLASTDVVSPAILDALNLLNNPNASSPRCGHSFSRPQKNNQIHVPGNHSMPASFLTSSLVDAGSFLNASLFWRNSSAVPRPTSTPPSSAAFMNSGSRIVASKADFHT